MSSVAATSSAGSTGPSGPTAPASAALFACSKCFARHPFEELSQGQQLCKECRGSFPVVKCTYCRFEFQQESKTSTSTICKKCEQNVAKYGKPSSCQYCSIIAAFVNGKCHRCHDSYRKYGPPKTCEQCKQKCAFDKEDKKKLDGKLLCWLCSLSYKRALVRTKQSDPARHSRVFKEEKERERREKRKQQAPRDKYFNHKKPQRPDVTKMGGVGLDEPLPKIAKLSKERRKERGDSDTDHIAEITQLKEKIASLQKVIQAKNNELLAKQAEMTQMKAKLFNEENLIKEKMKKMQKEFDDKIGHLQKKANQLSSENAKLRRDVAKVPRPGARKNELFPGANKKDLITLRRSEPKPKQTAAGAIESSNKYGGKELSSAVGSRSQSRSPERRDDEEEVEAKNSDKENNDRDSAAVDGAGSNASSRSSSRTAPSTLLATSSTAAAASSTQQDRGSTPDSASSSVSRSPSRSSRSSSRSRSQSPPLD